MQVKSFKTPEEVDDWLFRNPMQVPGALHFVDVSPSLITYGLQTNSTPIVRRGHYEDPTFKFQIPLQIAAEREIARSIIKGLKSLICQIFYVEIVLDTQISFFSLIKSCETNSFFFFFLTETLDIVQFQPLHGVSDLRNLHTLQNLPFLRWLQ